MSGTRCQRCGRLLVPDTAVRTESASRRDPPAMQPERASQVPLPPSVIYTSVVQPDTTSDAGPRMHRTAPSGAGSDAPGASPGPACEIGPDAAAGPTPGAAREVATSASGAAGGGSSAQRDPAIGRASGIVGPPPPYRTVTPPSRPAPVRPEIAPAPATPPVNIRGIGALGLPPPYRPIVQAASVFGRGPAPDLEPWRLASATHTSPVAGLEPEWIPVSADSSEADWSISRDSEPEIPGTSSPLDDARREVDRRADPLAWAEAPPVRPPSRLPVSGQRARFRQAGASPSGPATLRSRDPARAVGRGHRRGRDRSGWRAVFRTRSIDASDSRDRRTASGHRADRPFDRSGQGGLPRPGRFQPVAR